MAQQTINSGSPPIVWSTVQEAFTKINANFDEIYATIGVEIGSIVDFANLNSNVSPSLNETYDLGSASKRWKDLYLSGSTLYLGTAQITADITGAVNLPAGSTVAGELIRNPIEASFKNVSVAGQDTIEADQYTDTITFANGNAGITITTDQTTDTVTIANSGILSISGTASQIGATTVAGITTLTNLGVLSLAGEAGGIAVSAATGSVTITNLGVKRVVAGSGISITPSGGTGTVTIENTLPASPTFRTFRVDGDFINQVQADPGNLNDTLNITSGYGMIITPNATTDTITFAVNNTIDIKGSVFGFDSSLIVDGTSGNVFGQTITAAVSFQGNLTGNVTGTVSGNAGSATVASTVDITNTNGLTTVYYPTFTENRTTGQILRGDVDLSYRTDTNTLTAVNFAGNLTGTVTGNIFTTLIDSADSSAITVTPAAIFSSDVTVENDLIVSNLITSVRLNATLLTATSITATEMSIGKIEETFSSLFGATGTVVHDCASSHIFLHTSLSANFTANFTNLNLESGRGTTVSLILVQGGTAYIPNAVQIGGVAQTILWQGSSPPSGNINKTDIVAFSIINNNGTYSVFGQLTSFGT